MCSVWRHRRVVSTRVLPVWGGESQVWTAFNPPVPPNRHLLPLLRLACIPVRGVSRDYGCHTEAGPLAGALRAS
jgi:hypothetical protein